MNNTRARLNGRGACKIKKLISAAVSVAVLLSCATGAHARGQRMVTLRSGLYRMDISALEGRLGAFDSVAVTVLPPASRAVFYLDGHPVSEYQTLSREQLGRMWVFVTEGAYPASAGMLPFSPNPANGKSGEADAMEVRYRIRCINPVFAVNNNSK